MSSDDNNKAAPQTAPKEPATPPKGQALRDSWHSPSPYGDGKTPLVSISMLSYNTSKYIGQAIESILDQIVDFEVELIIGDDCSTDGSQDLLREYRDRYPYGIRLHLHKVRGEGIPGKVNNMHNLNDCRGRYIAILDADDYWIGNRKLYDQAHFLEEHPGHSSCSANGLLVLDNGETKPRLAEHARLVGNDMTLDYYARYAVTAMIPSSLMFRREWVMPLPDWFKEAVVADQYIKLLLLNRGPCRFLPGMTHAYRMHSGNFTSQALLKGRGALVQHDDTIRMRRTLPWVPYGSMMERRQLQRLRLAASSAIQEKDFRLLLSVVERLPPYLRVSAAKKLVSAFLRKVRISAA